MTDMGDGPGSTPPPASSGRRAWHLEPLGYVPSPSYNAPGPFGIVHRIKE